MNDAQPIDVNQNQLLVFYLLLFLVVGAGFILVHLIAGKFIRPAKPGGDKLTIYECGEPTIGSSWIQFDLRFYVVALLFVIFDVEVAFFFPWAVVFGRVNAINRPDLTVEQHSRLMNDLMPSYTPGLEKFQEDYAKVDKAERGSLAEYESQESENRAAFTNVREHRRGIEQLAWLAFWDIAVFFAVLLVGFAYLWKRGDLNWVRSVAAEMPEEGLDSSAPSREEALAGASRL